MPLRFGILGCGMMGREHIRNIQLFDDSAVTAIFEPNAAMVEEAKAFVPDAAYVDTEAELLARDDVDALLIASPNYCHADNLRQILTARHRPLLVEKPLITDPTDLAFIDTFARDYKAPVWVGMEYRYMPPVAKFIAEQSAVTGGLKMLSIREHRFPFLPKVDNWNRFNAQSGGTLVEKCCHFFDLMRLITGSEAVRVMASGGQAHNHRSETYDGATPDIWDNAFVIVEFDNGTRAHLDLCMFAEASRFQEEISAVGPKGKIECFVPGPTRLWPDDLGKQPEPFLRRSIRSEPWHASGRQLIEEEVPVDESLLIAGDHHGSTYYQHQAFREMLLNGGKPTVTLEDGKKAVQIGMAAQESARTGQTIDLR